MGWTPKQLAAVACSVGLLYTACASSPDATEPTATSAAPGSPGSSSTSSTSVVGTTAPPAPVSGVSLRGFLIASFTCPASLNPGASWTLPTGEVTTVLLCPPETPHQEQQPVTVSGSNRGFKALLTALAAPDQPRQADQACPALAVVPSPILARTPSQTVLVKVPVDSCAFPQAAVQTAINEAKSG